MRSGLDDEEGPQDDVASRMRRLEDQVRLLRHQNRMFVEFMQTAADQLGELKEIKAMLAAQGPGKKNTEIMNRRRKEFLSFVKSKLSHTWILFGLALT